MRHMILCVSLRFFFAVPVYAQDLTVGSTAPPITAVKWVSGGQIDRLESDNTYVIVFCSTWSAPCRDNISQLAELKAKC